LPSEPPVTRTRGIILTPDDQVHPDTHALTMVNNVIGVVNYVIAARPSLRNFMIADSQSAQWRPRMWCSSFAW